MARILTPEEFRQCPAGTVFAHGPKWSFGTLQILDEIIPPNKDGQWGFWSFDPMYPEVDDWVKADPLMEESLRTGRRFDCDMSATKTMNYSFGEDARDFAVFIVLDRQDWDRINSIVAFASVPAEAV